MKMIILAVSLMATSAFAQVGETCSQTKTFSSTVSSAFGTDRCDLWSAESMALSKCRRAGFSNCKRASGRSAVQVLEGANGQICTVTAVGTKACE